MAFSMIVTLKPSGKYSSLLNAGREATGGHRNVPTRWTKGYEARAFEVANKGMSNLIIQSQRGSDLQ